MGKINKKTENSWYVITDVNELTELYDKLTNFNVWNPEDTSIFLKYGYKNLSTGDKETYYELRDLARISKSKQNLNYCKVSYQYLALVLGTTERCQMYRIQKLETAQLVSIDRHKSTANHYYVNMNPNPDSTFIETIDKAITRKMVLNLIYRYCSTNNIAERLELGRQIAELDSEKLYYDTFKKAAEKIEESNSSSAEFQEILDDLYGPKELFN